MMTKKRSAAALLCAVLLASCAPAEPEVTETETTPATTTATTPPVTTTAPETTTTEITYETIYDDSGAFSYAGELTEKGSDEYGYIQVPADFLRFKDDTAEDVLQYCDATGKNIITLRRNIGTDYQSAAQNLLSYMDKAHEIEDLTAATLKVGGYESIQIHGHYPDGYFLVIWLIEDPDNDADSYYLSMEFDAEHQYIMACSSTFLTTDAHNAQ